ncbi:carbonic anhydrase 6 [Drosophila santomea]|uniref:carbonic anhydrase 6 n=1 Tax=Drosophila santomea TaxID=129105 RepID=UPI001954D774|nr:carbonic anhydrase 6 [Drosophila santomea]
MFDTTLGTVLSLMVQLVFLILYQILGQMVQHPLITTGLCLLGAFIYHADQESLKDIYQRVPVLIRIPQRFWNKSNLRYPASGYGYDMNHGPHTWLPKSGSSGSSVGEANCFQSPVNIDETQIQRLAIRELLNWNHFDDLPASITLENTGQTLILRAQFHGNAPTISGADLLASYTFLELRFHWGWCNSEGSEHTINHRKFPLEMQVMHKTGSGVPGMCTSSYDLLMIGYFFDLSAHNPYLDPLVQNLRLVQKPGTRVQIPPFPISYLMYPFRSGFYSYGGSLTHPPCYQGTEWFIFPESLAISDFQLRHFRLLLGPDGISPIARNSRPVQNMGNRVVSLNCFCPYDAAQLSRMHVELCQQQAQEEHEEDRIEQEQQLELERELERQRERDLKVQQERASDAAIAASEDEGQLVETIDTTTIITSSSNTSICMTTLLRKDSPRELEQTPQVPMMAPNQGSFCNPGIVIFSSGNESKSKCGIHQDTPEELMIHNRGIGVGMNLGGQNGCKADAFCSVGDGVNIGVRMEMVE